jgi:hypothetical protein
LLTSLRGREAQPVVSQTETVAWVAEYLKDRIGTLEPDEIPNGAALSMLLWAKQNETEFRQMYDAKRMERPEALSTKKGSRRGPVGGAKQDIDRLLKRNGVEAQE